MWTAGALISPRLTTPGEGRDAVVLRRDCAGIDVDQVPMDRAHFPLGSCSPRCLLRTVSLPAVGSPDCDLASASGPYAADARGSSIVTDAPRWTLIVMLGIGQILEKCGLLVMNRESGWTVMIPGHIRHPVPQGNPKHPSPPLPPACPSDLSSGCLRGEVETHRQFSVARMLELHAAWTPA
jgi:hypothetical protein